MRYCNERSFRSQFEFLRQQFLQEGELPFNDVLSRETVEEALDTIKTAWNESIYTPLTTLWIFLGQVMCADHSCRAAVARFVAHRVSRGQRACSSHTGAYCQARKRLPEKFFSCIARLGHVTPARLSQIMGLLMLAPDIQEAILMLPKVHEGRDMVPERDLRQMARFVASICCYLNCGQSRCRHRGNKYTT